MSLRALSVWSDACVLVAEWIVDAWLADGVGLVDVVVLESWPLRVVFFVALDALSWWSLLLGRADPKNGASSLSHAIRRR